MLLRSLGDSACALCEVDAGDDGADPKADPDPEAESADTFGVSTTSVVPTGGVLPR